MTPVRGSVAHMGNPTPIGDELLTSAQVAELTGWSQTSVNRWALRGDLPSEHKSPGRTGPRLFRRSVIEQRVRARGHVNGLISATQDDAA